MEQPSLSAEDCARLCASLEEADVGTAAALLYRHLLWYHHDCSWCDLVLAFPVLPPQHAVELLQWREQTKTKKKRRDEEDRYDFSIDNLRVRLRRAYCKSPMGMVGAVWCDRVYEYLVQCGCMENVGVELSKIELHVVKPRQLAASVTLQAVLETDYRFDVIPFHKHKLPGEGALEIFPGIFQSSEYRGPETKPLDVPACTYSPFDRSAPLATATPSFEQPGYATTTRMGERTQGWTDVRTTVAAFTGQVRETNHRQSTAVRYRLAYATYVYIRENPVYTFQFHGATNRPDGPLGVAVLTNHNSPPPQQQPSTDSANKNGAPRRNKPQPQPAANTASLAAATQKYLPGICAASGAIWRQRMPNSSSVLVYQLQEYIGNNAEADLAAYVALRIGLQRCLENGFHPLILQSDNPQVVQHLDKGFIRTLGNYKQQALHAEVAPMLAELVAKNEDHQEALLAATTVQYINKDKLRAERMPGVVLQAVGAAEMSALVVSECAEALRKGESLDRGWVSGLY